MRAPARRLALVAALALGAAGLAGAQQQKTPESLLPPGFGDAPAPASAPSGAPSPRPSAAVPMVQPLPGIGNDQAALPLPEDTPTPAATVDGDALRRIMADYELPSFARRSLATVGQVTTADGGLPPDAFGGADGRYLEELMRRLNAPIASRWLSIALRRALVSELDTPVHVNGADFAAERAWLLLRMGEASAARGVVNSVDNGHFTPKLYQLAMQVMLATADPGAVCGVVDAGRASAPDAAWPLAQAMCAALSADPRRASALFKAARRQHLAGGVDLQLAEKVIGAAPGGHQAVTIEWNSVLQLNAWRYGLATATGVTIPDELYGTVGPQVAGWRALAPNIAVGDRVVPAERAAVLGVLSSAALIDLYGAVAAEDEPPAAPAATANDLASAYADPTTAGRAAALHRLWGDAVPVPYARLVLTARAAARVRPSGDNADADKLVAAMLSAGLDRTAQRWRGVVPASGDAWAMLELADPDARGAIPYGQVAGYAGSGDAQRKRQLLLAGLSGLGRISPDDAQRAAQSLDVRIGAENSWTRALGRAVRLRQPGTVLLLCAIGMQTPDWRGVPAEALYRIVAALHDVGLDGEARMIAAEAIARA